jgi:hypothetical protein
MRYHVRLGEAIEIDLHKGEIWSESYRSEGRYGHSVTERGSCLRRLCTAFRDVSFERARYILHVVECAIDEVREKDSIDELKVKPARMAQSYMDEVLRLYKYDGRLLGSTFKEFKEWLSDPANGSGSISFAVVANAFTKKR